MKNNDVYGNTMNAGAYIKRACLETTTIYYTYEREIE
jgi:hypothetical protein